MTTFRRALYLGLWLLVSPGCEPGFSYVVPGARTVHSNGLRSLVKVADGVEARFYASVVIKSGMIDVQILNQSEDRIEYRFADPEITYAGGKPLPETKCSNPSPDQPIALARGTMVAVTCRFVVKEIGSGYIHDYRYLRIELPGFSRNGAPLKVAATMEWDN